jgi:hypothetical protein
MQKEPETAEEPRQENESLPTSFDDMKKRFQKETRARKFWKYLAIATICIVLYAKKSNVVWSPVADSQQMCVLVSDWWGLRAQAYYPVWRKPTLDTREYSEQWCIKYPNDTWEVFYTNRDGPAYTYPLITYNSYF